MSIKDILKHYELKLQGKVDKKNWIKDREEIKKWNVWFVEKRRNILRNVPDAIKLVAAVVMIKEYVLIVWLKRYVRVK